MGGVGCVRCVGRGEREMSEGVVERRNGVAAGGGGWRRVAVVATSAGRVLPAAHRFKLELRRVRLELHRVSLCR